jgi:hypothetical protein
MRTATLNVVWGRARQCGGEDEMLGAARAPAGLVGLRGLRWRKEAARRSR